MEDVQDGLRTAIRNLGELPGKLFRPWAFPA